MRKTCIMGNTRDSRVSSWRMDGTLTQQLSVKGSDGYCVLRPSRQNSRTGRMQSQTIHQMTTLHSAEASTAREHLERGEGKEQMFKLGSQTNKIINK